IRLHRTQTWPPKVNGIPALNALVRGNIGDEEVRFVRRKEWQIVRDEMTCPLSRTRADHEVVMVRLTLELRLVGIFGQLQPFAKVHLHHSRRRLVPRLPLPS